MPGRSLSIIHLPIHDEPNLLIIRFCQGRFNRNIMLPEQSHLKKSWSATKIFIKTSFTANKSSLQQKNSWIYLFELWSVTLIFPKNCIRSGNDAHMKAIVLWIRTCFAKRQKNENNTKKCIFFAASLNHKCIATKR